jgi:hypothetical protein
LAGTMVQIIRKTANLAHFYIWAFHGFRFGGTMG